MGGQELHLTQVNHSQKRQARTKRRSYPQKLPVTPGRYKLCSQLKQFNQRKYHMSRKIVQTEKAPKAIGPYAQAIKVNGFVYTAGQIPLDPRTGEMTEGGITAQTRQVLENLQAVLEAAGSSFNHVVKATVFLKNMSEFTAMNEIYSKYLGDVKPARSTVAVAELPRGALVEIDLVAVV
jgi:2-iminobutanoate/2-iminopropanoate deaminase